jgi:hypothetical protein
MKKLKRIIQFFRFHDFKISDVRPIYPPLGNFYICKKCGERRLWISGIMLTGLAGFLFYYDCPGRKG